MNLVDLLTFAAELNASDLHLSAGMPPVVRVDGDMRRLELPVLSHGEVSELISGILDDNQRQDYETQFDCDFSYEVPQLGRFRVNAFLHQRGAGAVFRVIPPVINTLEALGCPESFKAIISVPNGLILVTGPTGSGKSTTLAAMIDYKNRTEQGHILTIEDPIEFVHESQGCLISQRQLQRDTRSFSAALRAALREDPDIILVGEMRDLETIRLALTAAETGHLVFATLHTSSAPKTIDRIIDVFPAAEKPLVRSMLAESLRAVIAQTLLKRTDGGRVAAWEIMIGVPAIRNLIREDKTAQMYSTIQTGQAHGMQTLDQALARLVKNRVVSQEDALAKAQNKAAFRSA